MLVEEVTSNVMHISVEEHAKDIAEGRVSYGLPAFPKATRNASSPHWNTPEYLLDYVLDFFGEIDLDPCSNDYSAVPAQRKIAPPQDGLAEEWYGNVWMNPPFSRGIGLWFKKAADSYEFGHSETLSVCNSSTETEWFQNQIFQRATAICYPKGRIEFSPNPLTPESSSNTKGHAIVYYGDSVKHFDDVFSELGHVEHLRQQQGWFGRAWSALSLDTHK